MDMRKDDAKKQADENALLDAHWTKKRLASLLKEIRSLLKSRNIPMTASAVDDQFGKQIVVKWVDQRDQPRDMSIYLTKMGDFDNYSYDKTIQYFAGTLAYNLYINTPKGYVVKPLKP
jgi:hypothetical protein